jgi:hypothetical protein
MQLGKSLVGALVGSAVGVCLVVAIYYLFEFDHAGLSILVAACAGLGVRALVTTKGHASYMRGALTCLLAIGAFAASKFLIVDMARRGVLADMHPIKRVAAQPSDAAAGDIDNAAAAQQAEIPHIEQRPSNAVAATGNRKARPSFSAWDFISLSVAALIAYELGRGTEATHPTAPVGEAAPRPEPPAAK